MASAEDPKNPSPRPPLHPWLIFVVAIFLPGVGQLLNNAPHRGLMMLFFMLMLGIVSYNLADPGVSLIGKFAGGIFIYCLSVMDAYYWARYRFALFSSTNDPT